MAKLYLYVGLVFATALAALAIYMAVQSPAVQGPGEARESGGSVISVYSYPNWSYTTMVLNSTVGPVEIPVKGKITVMTFQYLRCPDICHWESYVFAYLMNRTVSSGLGDRVVFVTIDVDPWRDTLDDVRKYQAMWIGRSGVTPDRVSWIWVLDDPDKMDQAYKNFKIFVAPTSEGLITHSAGFYIFDQSGRLAYVVLPKDWSRLDSIAASVWSLVENVAKSKP